jgi:hypothetical protein
MPFTRCHGDARQSFYHPLAEGDTSFKIRRFEHQDKNVARADVDLSFPNAFITYFCIKSDGT